MITALLQTRLPEPVTPEEARAMFRRTAPNYRNKDGLIRKYYLLSEDRHSVGGVYLWESREQAEQVYNDDWREYVRATFGDYPSLTYFDTPLVDNTKLGEYRVALILQSVDADAATVRFVAFPRHLAADRFDIKDLSRQFRDATGR